MVATTDVSASLRETGSATAAHKGWEVNLLAAGELQVRLFGQWVLSGGTRSSTELSRRLGETPRPTKISFDAREVGAWDNVLIDFLGKLETIAAERSIAVDGSGLPGGAKRLLALARAVPERAGARRTQQRSDLLTRVGRNSLSFFAMTADFVAFLGEALIGVERMLVGKARLRRSDLMLAIEDCGPYALPIVALISFLVASSSPLSELSSSGNSGRRSSSPTSSVSRWCVRWGDNDRDPDVGPDRR